MPDAPTLEPLDEFRWQIPRNAASGMHVPGVIFAGPLLIESLRHDPALQQVANVATLPGIQLGAFAMPDIHFGYGFPVGGVAAFDLEEGVVSPGGIGYDINCGVRLLRVPLRVTELRPQLKRLMDALYRRVPSGVGSRGGLMLSASDMDEVLAGGAAWMVQKGFGREADLRFQEEEGCLSNAEPAAVSESARKRGMRQLGTLGSGNHFLEVQAVDEIFFPEFATQMGLETGGVAVMLHTGSRGLGHQVATDFITKMDSALRGRNMVLVDRQLSCAPVSSPEGQEYLGAMAAGANFAWANRQMITEGVRQAFADVFGSTVAAETIEVVYDIAHNI
ncbi:MAG TPA: RtcB family protein, partial [Thermoplasmata archaeon]|nr:RtcB family protein [Thermoplasmata archaeon]